MKTLDRTAYLPLIELALAEDIGGGDVTSLSVIPQAAYWAARMVAREEIVVAGMSIVSDVFRQIDPEIEFEQLVSDGELVLPGECVATLKGNARAILAGERTALNFVQRLSGVATLTRSYVSAVQGTSCEILDTRKTTPGWRVLEKHAVACGGGRNHRVGLFDMVMIKDNHLAVLSGEKAPIAVAVQRAKERYPSIKVEVEADTIDQAVSAAESGADVILLDNMSIAELRESVSLIANRSKTEASGGITLASIREIAETGVDYISVGALTHSAPSVDLALDIDTDPVR